MILVIVPLVITVIMPVVVMPLVVIVRMSCLFGLLIFDIIHATDGALAWLFTA